MSFDEIDQPGTESSVQSEIVNADTPPAKDPDLIQPEWVLRIPPLGA